MEKVIFTRERIDERDSLQEEYYKTYYIIYEKFDT